MEPREVLTYLKLVPAFRALPEEQGERELLRLLPYVRERRYEAGNRLLIESRVPHKTIIIVRGRVAIKHRTGTGELRELGQRTAGTVLGRTTLEPGDFERMTVEAIEPTHTLELPFRDLVKTYQKSHHLREQLQGPLKPDRLVNTLKGIPLFSRLTDRLGELELHQIATIVCDQYFENGEWLFRQGEISDRLFCVLAGEVELTQVDPEGISHQVGTLGPGDSAGETGLLIGDFHDVTAAAKDYARVLYLTRAEFRDLLRDRPYLERNLNISEGVARRRRLRHFDWLRDDEWIISVLQRHWIRLFRQIGPLILILLLLVPVLVSLLSSGNTLPNALAVVLAIPMVLLIGGIVWQYFNWRDDYFVVTTQRVVHIERVWPLATQLREASLDNTEGIYETQPGLSANLLDYGHLVFQTAGDTVDIDMTYVPNPGGLRETISEQIERSRARKILRTRGEIRDLLAQTLQWNGEPASGDDRQPATGTTGRQSTQQALPALLLTSLLELLFPPSRVESEDGRTIVWHRYWLPGLMRRLPVVLLFALTTIGGPLLASDRFAKGENGSTILIIWLFLEAVIFAILLWLTEDWHNDYFELTPSHIILQERRPLFLQQSRQEARLDRIQNLGYEVPSILGRIFDFGHIHFETAGTEGKVQLQFVRHPAEVQQTISNRQYEYRQRQMEIEASRRQQELLHWFSTYDELHREAASSVPRTEQPEQDLD